MNQILIEKRESKEICQMSLADYSLSEFISGVKNLGITEIEPLLQETDLQEGSLTMNTLFTDKYFILAVLNDIFKLIILEGEDKLIHYESECGYCYKGCKIDVFYGEKTNLHFGLKPERNSYGIYFFHFCWAYNDLTGEKITHAPMIDFWGKKYLEFKQRGIID